MKGFRRYTVLFIYVAAFGAIGQAWISDVFSLKLKIMITIGSVAFIVLGFALQARWEPSEESINLRKNRSDRLPEE